MAIDRKLIVEEKLTKPSAVSPMLFVGLGGCGCQMVARIARHLQSRSDYEECFSHLIKFALVDTNVNDLESYREYADETFLISDFEKEQYANLAAGKEFLEADGYFTQWIPPNYRFRAGETAGAGQIRIEARLGVYYHMKHKEFVPRFRQLLEDLKSHESGHRRLDTAEIRIIFCYSVAGGTGSGCHMPIVYMLRDQARELGNPRLIGVAVMPSIFEDKTKINSDGTFANSYAALKETEHLMKLGAPESRFFPDEGLVFHYDSSDPSKTTIRERPFEFLYIIDKPESFTVPEPIDAAADGLYLQLFSPLFGEQMSDYDNYTQHQRYLVPYDFEEKGIIGFTTFYGSYGAAVLLVPVEGLVEYCSQSAALSLMRASFLGEIPGNLTYARLRANRDTFYEVTIGEEKNENPIHEAEFRRKEPLIRDKLRDRLFMKRVRLLAGCELSHGEQRFLEMFRHGHRLGELPKIDGTFELKQDRIKQDRQLLAEQEMRFSIAAVVLHAVAGEQQGKEPGLLAQARATIDSFAEEIRQRPRSDVRVADLLMSAGTWREDFTKEGMRILNDGCRIGTVRLPGMESLVELDFMKSEAGEVNLVAKRYAVLRILKEVDWNIKAPERREIDAGGRSENEKIREKDAPAFYEMLEQQAKDRAMDAIRTAFIEKLGDFRRRLDEFAKVQRVLELGFADLERERSRRLERLRDQGELSANRYVLSAEALQAVDGRRLWDFYYEDKISGLPELSLGHHEVQQVLSDTVTDLSVTGTEKSTTMKLEELFVALKKYAGRLLKKRICGDPYSPERERREGLTLSDALELEIVYRALYRSHADDINSKGNKIIQAIVGEYRTQPPEQQLDFADPVHSDYLRDKIKRVVNEKASLLCVYEESRDQHGGVRPDHVFLAAIDENFKNSNIEEALTGTDIADLKWVTTAWHNPREIIFYRAILNVPLYVFGRMDKMRERYHGFKLMANRPKTLHIDRNWEDQLPDIDPLSAQETHRKNLVRDQIINFATLLTSPLPSAGKIHCIVQRKGKYFLVDPKYNGDVLATEPGKGLTLLGRTMSEAVQRLPEILEASVKYMDFQDMLTCVRNGYSPQVLGRIADLPFKWREQREEYLTRYGSQPTPPQQETLKDYGNSYNRLQEALESLLAELRNREFESDALAEEDRTPELELSVEEAQRAVEQSVGILESFGETWKRVDDPNRTRKIPETFKALFRPLSDEGFRKTIDRITKRHTGAKDEAGGARPSAKTESPGA